jgi:large subunit ribosomal protein L17
MRHKQSRHKGNRFTSWHRATIKSMLRSILLQQSINTTKGKALMVKAAVDKMITLGKLNTLAAKRKAFDLLGDHDLVTLLFNEIAPRFKERAGGYTRVINLGKRRGDNAALAILELTEIKKKEEKVSKKKKASKVQDDDKDISKEEAGQEKSAETKSKGETHTKEKPPAGNKPSQKFLGGIRGIFKKKSDAL